MSDSKTKEVNVSLVEPNNPWYAVMRRYVAKHHPHLKDVEIALAWRHGWKADQDNRLTLGMAKKTTDLERELGTKADAVILLNAEAWEELNNSQREALVDHELCHLELARDKDDKPKEDERGRQVLRMRGHDIEEFDQIVERHGLYLSHVERFVKAALQKKADAAQEGPLFCAHNPGDDGQEEGVA